MSDFVSHFLAGRAPSVGKPTSSPLSGKSTPLQRGNPPSLVGLRGRLRMTGDDRTHIISFCHSDSTCLTGLGRISKRYGLKKYRVLSLHKRLYCLFSRNESSENDEGTGRKKSKNVVIIIKKDIPVNVFVSERDSFDNEDDSC